MSKIIENIKIKDKNGDEIILNKDTELYDTVNKIKIKANYNECISEEYCWNIIVDNILNGRLTLNVC
jgi:hypothetical protein